MRILDFADGFESSSPPSSIGFIADNVLITPSGNMVSNNVKDAVFELQGDVDTLSATKLNLSEKGSPSGVATLDVAGKVPSSQLPSIAITDVYVVADNTARNALIVQAGDVAKVTATDLTYIWDGISWVELTANSLLTAHTGAATAAHAASAVSFSPVGTIAATDAQSAIAEVATDAASALTTHEADTTSVHGIADTSKVVIASTMPTLKGDVLVHNGVSVVSLAVGANGTYLKASSGAATGLEWASAAANLAVSTKTAGYTLTASDDLILADATTAAFTLNLPTAVGNTGKIFRFKKIDSTINTVTIDASTTETIDGALTYKLNGQYNSITIISDGANWRKINADEIVAVRASTAGGQALGAASFTKISFETETQDSFGVYASGTFTAPLPGTYLVGGMVHSALTAFADDAAFELRVYKNGSSFSSLGNGRVPSEATGLLSASGSELVSLVAGDTLEFYVYTDTASSIVASFANLNHIYIVRVGN